MRRPFSCGTQYGDWVERNCEVCLLYDREKAGGCEIDDALGLALFGDGTVSEEIAERMGATDPRAYSWECPERQPR